MLVLLEKVLELCHYDRQVVMDLIIKLAVFVDNSEDDEWEEEN